jgi:hypothetical protein
MLTCSAILLSLGLYNCIMAIQTTDHSFFSDDRSYYVFNMCQYMPVSGMVTDYKNLVTSNWENRMKDKTFTWSSHPVLIQK